MSHISHRPLLVGARVVLAGVVFKPESEKHGKDLVRRGRARLATDEEIAAQPVVEPTAESGAPAVTSASIAGADTDPADDAPEPDDADAAAAGGAVAAAPGRRRRAAA